MGSLLVVAGAACVPLSLDGGDPRGEGIWAVGEGDMNGSLSLSCPKLHRHVPEHWKFDRGASIGKPR